MDRLTALDGNDAGETRGQDMLRHCVMFKWADGVGDETKATVAAGLDRLAGLECVAGYRHGPDAGLNEGNWDYVVVGDFETVEDYRSYATEAGHVALIADHIGPNISDRAAVQYHLD